MSFGAALESVARVRARDRVEDAWTHRAAALATAESFEEWISPYKRLAGLSESPADAFKGLEQALSPKGK